MTRYVRPPRSHTAQAAHHRLRSRRGVIQLIGLVSVLAVLALLGAGVTRATSKSTSSLPSEYKIGVNMALTGATAPYDQPALAGLKMAVAEINARGGIGGQSKIVLTIRNDRSEAGQAAADAQTLAAKGVDFM